MAKWEQAPEVDATTAAPKWAEAPEVAPASVGEYLGRMGTAAVRGFNDALIPDAMQGEGSWFPKPSDATGTERVAASAGRMLGMSAPVAGGMAALSRAIPAAIPPAASFGERVLQSVLNSFRTAPVGTSVMEGLTAGGAGVGGGIAGEAAPGSAGARMTGELLGGLAPAVVPYAPIPMIISAIRSRLSPAAQAGAARSMVADTLRGQLGDETGAALADARAVQQRIPGFEPSLAEAAGAPSLVRTQQAIEGKASGAELDALTARHRANQARVEQFAETQAPRGEGPEFVIDTVRRRVDRLRDRVGSDAAMAEGQRERLGRTLPVPGRAAIGQNIRDALQQERVATKTRLNELAEELGINNADVTMEFGPMRDEIKALFAPKSVLEDPDKVPAALRALDALGKDESVPITFRDLKAYRERVGDDLRDAESSSEPKHALVRNLAILREKVDEAIDKLAEQADPALRDRYQQFRQAWYQDYVERFEKGAAFKIRAKDGRGFYRTPDERVAEAFFQPGNVSGARQFKSVFGKVSTAEADIEAAALDSLRDAALRDGVIDPKLFATWRRQHDSVLEEFPRVLSKVDSVGRANESLVSRQGQLTQRARRIEDTLLARELQSFERGTKTADQIIDSALANPRKMTGIVKAAKRIPGGEDALRRALWDRATMGDARSTATFIAQNADALKSVLGDRHFENAVIVQKARAMLERVGEPAGRGVSPEPLQDLEAAVGMGVPQLASRIFAAESGRTSWRYIAMDALGRFMRGRSKAETEALYREALYNPEVAEDLARLITAKAPEDTLTRRLNAYLFNLGRMDEEQDNADGL